MAAARARVGVRRHDLVVAAAEHQRRRGNAHGLRRHVESEVELDLAGETLPVGADKILQTLSDTLPQAPYCQDVGRRRR